MGGHGGLSKKKLKENKKRKLAKSAEAKLAQEQRVGKALPQYNKHKTSQARPKPKVRALNDTEKRIRALNKKLRDLEALRQKEADGATLDEQQLRKLDGLSETLEELEALMTGAAQ